MTLNRQLPRIGPRIGLVVLIAGAVTWAALNRDRFDPAALDVWLSGWGIWAALLYVVLYVIGTVVFVPGSLFALAGGALFGPVWGAILNLGAATIGASLAFVVARYIAGDWVARRAGGRLGRLIDGVEAEGWRFVAFVRLVPLFPFNLTNYALGLTRIGLVPYVVTSLICMAPGAVAYTWLGYAGREALDGESNAIRYGLLALALLAAIAFVPRLVRRLRGGAEVRWIDTGALSQRLGTGEATVIDVRGPEEFNGALGHIAPALNLPLDALPGRLIDIKALCDKPVIVVCNTDKRSAKAAALLSDAGFRDVQVLRGGMEQWNRDSLAVAGNGHVDQVQHCRRRPPRHST